MTDFTIYYDTGKTTLVNAADKLAALKKLGYTDVSRDAYRHDAYLPSDISHVSGPDGQQYKWVHVNNSYHRWVPVRYGPILGKYDMSKQTLGRLLCRHFDDAIPNAVVALRQAESGQYAGADSVTKVAGKFLVYLIENELINSSYGERWTNGLAWKFAKENPHIVMWVFL